MLRKLRTISALWGRRGKAQDGGEFAVVRLVGDLLSLWHGLLPLKENTREQKKLWLNSTRYTWRKVFKFKKKHKPKGPGDFMPKPDRSDPGGSCEMMNAAFTIWPSQEVRPSICRRSVVLENYLSSLKWGQSNENLRWRLEGLSRSWLGCCMDIV